MVGVPAAPGFSAKPNSGALANGGPAPAPSQPPAAKRSGPLFSTDDDMQPDSHGDGAGLAGMGGNSLGGDQVQGAAPLLHASHQVPEGLVLEELARLDRLADPQEGLHDDPAGAQVQVPDLGVAHLAVG